MKLKASERSALMIAAGLCACLWGPLQPTSAAAAPAASQDDAAPAAKKHPAHVHARHANKKTTLAKASKPIADAAKDESKSNAGDAAAAEAKPDGSIESAAPTAMATPSADLPASIANANAQFPPVAAAEGASSNATGPAQASGSSNAEPSASGVVAQDEVNDLDRAAADAPQPSAMTASSAAAAPSPNTTGAAQVSTAAGNDGAWDKASLIGKIFIAAGGLLTLASAARMFIA